MDFEKIFRDIEWIERALEDPTYLMVKQDHANMFPLSDDGEGYIRYIISYFKEKGYNVRRADRFISLEKKHN